MTNRITSRQRALAALIAAAGATAALAPTASAGPFTAPQRVVDPLPGAFLEDVAVGPGGAAAVAFTGTQVASASYADTRLWVAVHEQGALPTAALPRGFKLAVPVSPPGIAIESAQVGVDGAGNTTVVWWNETDYPGPDSGVYASYRPANGTWTAPQFLNLQGDNYDDPSIDPDLKVAPDGRAIVATEAGLFERAPGATEFTAIPDTGTVRKVALDPAGDVAAIFVDGRTEGDVTVRVRPAGGAWTTQPFGKLYNAYPGFLDYTAIGITSSGVVGASWMSQDGNLRYAQRTPGATFAAGSWGASRKINDRPVDTDSSDITYADESVTPESATQLAVRWRQIKPVGDFSRGWQRREWIFPSGARSTATPDFSYVFRSRPFAVSPTAAGRGIGVVAGEGSVRAVLRPKLGDAWSEPQTVIAPTGAERYGTAAVGLDTEGNGYVAWTRTYPAVGTDGPKTLVGLSGYDPVAPVIRSVTASAAKAGSPVALAATATDRMSNLTFTWTFGDGTATAAGAALTHTYAKAGTYAAKVQVRDEAGNTASWPKTIVVGA